MFKERLGASGQVASVLAVLLLATPLIATAELTAPTGLKADGNYDAFVFTSGDGVVADVDGNGSAEMFVAGIQLAWQRVRYDSASHGYAIDLSAPLPFPIPGGGLGRPTLVAAVGTPARYKVYSVIAPASGEAPINVAIHDAQTGDLDLIVQVGSGPPTAALDLDGDGAKEIVVIGAGVAVYDSTLTRSLGGSPVNLGAQFVIGNFDQDAAIEILTHEGVIFEFSGFELHEERRLPQGFDLRDIFVGAGDGDGDGIDELFLYDDLQHVRAVDVGSGQTRWEVELPTVSQFPAAGRVADVNGDEHADVLIVEVGHPADPAHVVAYDGATGDELLKITLEATGLHSAGIGAADFDGDGDIEIAVDITRPLSPISNLRIYDAATGQAEWESLNETTPFRALTLGDADGDGADEVIFSSGGLPGVGDIHLHAHNATTFEPLWTTPLPLLPEAGTGQITSLAIADIDDDGDREILVGTRKGADPHIWVVDGHTHEIEGEFALPTLPFATVSALTVADVDHDGDIEIVLGSRPESTGSSLTMSLLDPATGDVTPRYSSQGFREISAFATWETGAGVDLAFVDDRLQTDGSTLVYDAAPGGDAHFMPTDLALSVALLDSRGDSASEVVAGRVDGRIEVFDSRTLTSLSVTQVCTTPVYAIVPNRLPGAKRSEAFFACEERIGAIDVETGEYRGLTNSVGYTVGLGNSLVVTGTSASNISVTAAVVGGVRHFVASQAAPVALIPSLQLPVRTHWGRPVVAALNTTSFSPTPVTLEFVQQPQFGTVRSFPSTGPAFEYVSQPVRGTDHFVVRAVTDAGASPPVAIMVIVENNAPVVAGLPFTAQPGVEKAWFVGAQDADVDPLTYELLSMPTKGTIQFDAATGDYRYTAAANATGQDTFMVRAFDQVDHSETATVTVTIEQPTPPPPPPPPPPSPPPSGGGGGGGSLGWPWILAMLTAIGLRRTRRIRYVT